MKCTLLIPFALATFLVSCNSSSSKSASNHQYKYVATDKSYTAEFPAKPTEHPRSTQTQLGKINYVMVSYQDNINHRIYSTFNMKFPVNPNHFDVEQGLKNGLEAATKISNSTITSENKITYKSYPGREVTIHFKGSITGKARLFIDPKGPTLYQAFAIAKDGNVNSPEIENFLNSLNIK